MIDNKEFNELLEMVKYYHHFTLTQLAKRLDVGQPYLSDCRNNKKVPSDKVMDQLREMAGEIKSEPLKEEETERPTRFVPLLPVAAQGGSLNDFVMSVEMADCEKILSPVRGVEYAMLVHGESMSPEYPSGSHIFIKRINEKAFIEWGKCYVLDTCNGTVVKTLVPAEDEEHVRCISINKDPIYQPFEVAWRDVFAVYRVVFCMVMK